MDFINKNKEFYENILSKNIFEKRVCDVFLIHINVNNSESKKELDKFIETFTKYYSKKNVVFKKENSNKKMNKFTRKNNFKKLNKWIFIDEVFESNIPLIVQMKRKEILKNENEYSKYNIFRKHINDFILKEINETVKKMKTENNEENIAVLMNNLKMLFGKVNYEKMKGIKMSTNIEIIEKYHKYQKKTFEEINILLKNFFSKTNSSQKMPT